MTAPGRDPAALETAGQILHARALALARRPQEPPAPDTLIEILEFRLAHERYAVETRHVREVHPLRSLTPLPCAPAFVRGIVNVRGRIIAVLDIKRFFELPEVGLTDLHRVVLIQGHGMEVGLLADSVVGVQSIPLHELQEHLPHLTGIRADHLKGVTAQGLVVLDAWRLLEDPGIIVEEEVQP
ncbi:MAG TPA: chemotaxis protein CheW [Ramlibacter sp.]|nr:chemotaxis protein CheW [Ramlibacter sp.]